MISSNFRKLDVFNENFLFSSLQLRDSSEAKFPCWFVWSCSNVGAKQLNMHKFSMLRGEPNVFEYLIYVKSKFGSKTRLNRTYPNLGLISTKQNTLCLSASSLRVLPACGGEHTWYVTTLFWWSKFSFFASCNRSTLWTSLTFGSNYLHLQNAFRVDIDTHAADIDTHAAETPLK